MIAADGNTIYTRDLVWDDSQTETLIARLSSTAPSRGYRRSGCSTTAWFPPCSSTAPATCSSATTRPGVITATTVARRRRDHADHKLSILDDSDLGIAGEADVDSWASFMTAKAGRAIFSVSGGLLVVNVEDATHPFAQAYFATIGWASELLLDGDEILFAAGPYGIYRFDASTFNLLAP